MSQTSARPGLAIRWRLTIWIAVAFALTLAAVFLTVRVAVGQILDNDIDADLDRTYTEISELAQVRLGEPGIGQLVNDYPFPIVVLDQSGSVIANNNEADVPAMLPGNDELSAIVAGRTLNQTIEIDGDRYRVRSARVDLEPDRYIVLQVGRNTQAADDVSRTLNTILLGGGFGALVIVLVAGYWVARSALRPIDQVTELAAEIEASDLTRRLEVEKRPAEVQRLADTFDAMLARLESAFGQQRNFVMDVSHELRTPLTALRGNLDVMLMAPGLEPDVKAQLERMSSEVSRLIRLTSNLLYFAHAEAGRDIVRRPVDLDDLCLEVVRQARDIRRDVNVRLEHEGELSVAGDRDLLKQLVLNLVDNGVKFSPAGGEVVVSLHRSGGAAEIAVADRGPGVAADQIELIFERFYRVPGSDSRTVGGAGIGLAISRWIARSHGGDLRVESEVGHGSRFVVTLPLAGVTAPAVTP